MRIAVYGASGMIGSAIATEAVRRGHEVTGITRSGGTLPEGVAARPGDAGSADDARAIAAEHDAVVSAIGPSRTQQDTGEFRAAIRTLADTLGSARLAVVGGAGSLLVDGQRLVDSPDFPEAYRPESLVAAEALEDLRALPDGIDWTYLSPSPEIAPGPATSGRTLGDDSPAGSSVTTGDFAVAIVDELEHPAHSRRRFTVASGEQG